MAGAAGSLKTVQEVVSHLTKFLSARRNATPASSGHCRGGRHARRSGTGFSSNPKRLLAPEELMEPALSLLSKFTPVEHVVLLTAYHLYPPCNIQHMLVTVGSAPSPVSDNPVATGPTRKIPFCDIIAGNLSASLHNVTCIGQLITMLQTIVSIKYYHRRLLLTMFDKVSNQAQRNNLSPTDLLVTLKSITAAYTNSNDEEITRHRLLQVVCRKLCITSIICSFPVEALVQVTRELAKLRFTCLPLLTQIANQLRCIVPTTTVFTTADCDEREEWEDEEFEELKAAMFRDSTVISTDATSGSISCGLSTDDLIDLIGAYATLDVPFHMLVKGVSNALVQRTPDITSPQLVSLLHNLSCSSMFPVNLIRKLGPTLHDRIASGEDLTLEKQMLLLGALSRLRWREQRVLNYILASLKAHRFDNLNTFEKMGFCFRLFTLDVWDESLVKGAILDVSKLQTGFLDHSHVKAAVNFLLALSYFSFGEASVYNKLFDELLRHELSLSKEGITQLKIVELSLRVGHLRFSFKDVSSAGRGFLTRVRAIQLPPQLASSSGLQQMVGKTATFVSYHHYSEVQLGPYLLDFVRPLTYAEVTKRRQAPDSRNPLEAQDPIGLGLHRGGTVIEVDGPKHFYRGSRHWTSFSKLKHQLISSLGLKVVHVPYYDWVRLNSWVNRQAYLKNLLDKSHKGTLVDELTGTAPVAKNDENCNIYYSLSAASPGCDIEPPNRSDNSLLPPANFAYYDWSGIGRIKDIDGSPDHEGSDVARLHEESWSGTSDKTLTAHCCTATGDGCDNTNMRTDLACVSNDKAAAPATSYMSDARTDGQQTNSIPPTPTEEEYMKETDSLLRRIRAADRTRLFRIAMEKQVRLAVRRRREFKHRSRRPKVTTTPARIWF
eukprot:GHVQ01011007.1.p1 GENE.GHVQ01011007.1~~GHVQ01011007.1.p1  ORF type:complete len:890 (+),score=73.56 GHVQ01011007.1:6637-9306(+)